MPKTDPISLLSTSLGPSGDAVEKVPCRSETMLDFHELFLWGCWDGNNLILEVLDHEDGPEGSKLIQIQLSRVGQVPQGPRNTVEKVP